MKDHLKPTADRTHLSLHLFAYHEFTHHLEDLGIILVEKNDNCGCMAIEMDQSAHKTATAAEKWRVWSVIKNVRKTFHANVRFIALFMCRTLMAEIIMFKQEQSYHGHADTWRLEEDNDLTIQNHGPLRNFS